jgi:hypothetical protein
MKSYLAQLTPAFLELAKEIEKVPDSDGVVKQSAGSKLPEVARSIQHHVFRALPPLIEGKLLSTSISLNTNHYVSTNPYNTEQFRYNTHIQRAFKKLIDAGYITITTRGWQNRSTGQSDNTKYRLTAKFKAWLVDRLQEIGFKRELYTLVTDPMLLPKTPVLCVQRRKQGDISNREPRTEKVNFAPSHASQKIIENIEVINQLLAKTWIDLDLTEDGWSKLNERLAEHKRRDKASFIRFNKRQLYRVYHDTEFKTGGRYYGGWWETIPSEFRKHIVINGKATVEIDYSGFNPSILYAMKGLTAPTDSYIDIFHGEHRDLGKKLFNALLNAKHDIKNPPRATKISHTGKTWKQIKERIYELHEPIKEYFCNGAGLWLMYEESELATAVMHHFAKKGVACLPVHDSFIIHHGYEHELREKMTEIFRERYGVAPNTKNDDVIFFRGEYSLPTQPTIDDVLKANNTFQDNRLESFRALQQ